jgi:cation:H+ antiporter
MGRGALTKLALALLIPVPALCLRLAGIEPPPVYSAVVYGAAVVGAAVLLAWAAETAQLDISGSLAIALLALIAVLPEYAVDLYFGYTAGHSPEFAQYAAANMTGSNRLLIGLGWPLVAVFAGLGARRLRRGRKGRRARAETGRGAPGTTGRRAESEAVARAETSPGTFEAVPEAFRSLEAGAPARRLGRGGIELLRKRRIELLFLAVASVYSFIIPLTGRIAIYDAVVLLSLYVVYLWRVAREERQEPELIGVCACIGSLPCRRRRGLVIGMFVAAAAFVLAAAEPFANALVDTGAQLGIDQFLLVQWLAPLVSESPELIVACLLAYRMKGDDAIGTLLSSKVNQWTLLVGSLPLAFLIGGGGSGGLILDDRQTQEFLLTAAQTVLGFAVLSNLRFGWRDATLLFTLFVLQFPFQQASVRLGFSAAYLAMAAGLLFLHRNDLKPIPRYVFTFRRKAAHSERSNPQN